MAVDGENRPDGHNNRPWKKTTSHASGPSRGGCSVLNSGLARNFNFNLSLGVGPLFGQTWHRVPLQRVRLEKWFRIHPKPALGTNYKEIWWPSSDPRKKLKFKFEDRPQVSVGPLLKLARSPKLSFLSRIWPLHAFEGLVEALTSNFTGQNESCAKRNFLITGEIQS